MKFYRALLTYLLMFFSGSLFAESIQDYHQISLEGWKIYIEKSLVDKNDKRVFAALRVLKEKLQEISETMPEKYLPSLKSVPLWLSRNSGVDVEFYFYERRVARGGIDPKKMGGIEFKNISIFLEMIKIMPGLVIHELAHAYHRMNYDRIDKLVMRAFKNAQSDNLYREKSVKRNHQGQDLYASRNAYEYFADLTAMYYGTNDYYPYNRSDLKKHDPKGYEMIEAVWK